MAPQNAATPAHRDDDGGRQDCVCLGGQRLPIAKIQLDQSKSNCRRELFPHQVETRRQFYTNIRSGLLRSVAHLPTGAGKTVVACAIILDALSRGKRVAFVVPYISLVDQTCLSLGLDGILDVGVMQSDHPLWRPDAPVLVCSAQTLERRNLRPEVDLIIVDEAHRRNKHVLAWIKEANVPVLGLSATPWARGMGLHWDTVIKPVTMRELIAAGLLAKFRVMAAAQADLSKVRSRRGADGEVDYIESDLSGAMSDPTLVADVVATWCERAEGRPTIVFAVDCGHAHVLRSQFESSGVPVGYIDAKTPRLEREELRKRLVAGDIKIIVNIDCLTAGFDCPAVSCIVLARPTRSSIRYVQAVGRGLRTSPGKSDCLIIDHSDTTHRLGFVVDIAFDGLDDGSGNLTGSASRDNDAEPLPKTCPSCSFLKPPRIAQCPECGFTPESRREIICIDGALEELTPGKGKSRDGKFAWLSDDALLGQLQHYACRKQYKPGWATAKFKALRGHWPPRHIDPRHVAPPTIELASWIRSEAIRWAKSQGPRRHAG
jgi:DNA repair protein RadD